MSISDHSIDPRNVGERPDHPLPVRLETTFLTGPGGRIYELPREVADQYVLTMERLQELGHLPITPYGMSERNNDAMDIGDEVGGRHMVMLPSGTSGYHSDIRYGTFLWTDGQFYVGDHYHPYGTELAFTP